MGQKSTGSKTWPPYLGGSPGLLNLHNTVRCSHPTHSNISVVYLEMGGVSPLTFLLILKTYEPAFHCGYMALILPLGFLE